MGILGSLAGILIIVIAGYMIRKSGDKKDIRASLDDRHFMVSQPAWKGGISGYLFWANLVAFAVIVAINFGEKGSVDTTLCTVYMVVLPVLALLLLKSTKWRVVVDGDEVRCRALFRPERTFTFGEITKVALPKEDRYQGIWLYTGEEVASRIPAGCPGYNTLLSRLEESGIPFRFVGRQG